MAKKKRKQQCRLRNWSQYNKALVERGSLTVWISDEALSAWHNQTRTGKRGKRAIYTDAAILCMATIGEVYCLPLRATEGLTRSLLRLLGVELRAPDYTTLCRRRRALEVELPRRRKSGPLHLVVDSTGIKVYGEGEWKVRQHGWSHRRTWRKLHLAVDEATGEVAAAMVSTNSFKDSELLPDLLEQVEGTLSQVSADGAYDSRNCYDAIRRRARAQPSRRRSGRRSGDMATRRRKGISAMRTCEPSAARGARWKRESGYHRRSLAETAVFRVKIIFGERVRARSFEGQAAQLLVRCAALNRMTHLGMPHSYKLAA